MSYVGRPHRRLEDARFLTGRARYLDDLDPPGVVHVAFVRSDYAHARLNGVDVAEARADARVLRVFTGEDEPAAGTLPTGGVEGGEIADAGHPVLARGKVRYVGEPVAAVVAETRAAAEDAAELVVVDYEPLEPVLDAREAPGSATLVHEELGENVLLRWRRSAGDVESAFAAADRVVAQSFHVPRLVAAPMETRGALAELDRDEDLLTMWVSAQDPHRPLAQLAHALGRPTERIRMIVPDVGGAFGSKGAIGPEVVVTALAAIALGRPVKWAEDRAENFLAAYQGRGLDADVELAVSAEGVILGIRARIHADLGAYLFSTTAVSSHTTAMLLTGAYAIPAADVEVVGAATNKVPTGPYRGAGRPEAALVIERMVDLAAGELGLDPIDMRRRNLLSREGFPHRTPLGWVYDSGDFERCLDRALELVELDRWREERRRARAEGRKLGIGVAMYLERCGGQWESADVEVGANGRVVVRTGSSPHGQGHETTFAQIVAEELGVKLEEVEIRWGDTGEVPPGVGTFASRSVAMGGSALLLALREIREKGRARASVRFQSDLLFSSGCYAAVVEVDPVTGAVSIHRLAAVDDSGRIVNPLLAEGQVVGAVAQGLGQALLEEAVHDENGQPVTASFADYSLPTAMEMPEVASAFVETPAPSNPLGAKGIGEAGAIGAPAAVANAVADALGVRHVDFPFTEDKLWRLAQE